MDDIKKTEQSHDVSIALIQKDIGYIRESLLKIDTTMALFDRNFARKDELVALEKGMEKIVEEFKKEMEKIDRVNKEELAKKVNNSEYEPVKKLLGRINWLLISTIIIAVLAFIIKAGSSAN